MQNQPTTPFFNSVNPRARLVYTTNPVLSSNQGMKCKVVKQKNCITRSRMARIVAPAFRWGARKDPPRHAPVRVCPNIRSDRYSPLKKNIKKVALSPLTYG
jgi:hypothetical protein